MRRTATIVLVVLLGSLALAQAASAQRNTLRYPYGCVEDERLRPEGWEEGDPTPLRCTTSNFIEAHFASQADFSFAQFASRADFRGAQFASRADFRGAQFYSLAYFIEAHFASRAIFFFAHFASRADFSFAHFASRADFSSAQFWSPVDFREARFDSAATASFARTTVRDTLFLGAQGSDDVQRFDFRRVQFLSAGRDVHRRLSLFRGLVDSVEVRYPGAAVVLYGPVELQMQQAKFSFLRLAERLSYFEKEDIITYPQREKLRRT